MTDCLFCKIAKRDIPTEVILENEFFIAFNDINPKAPIHVLIIPKEHYTDISDVDGCILAELPGFIKNLSKKLEVFESGYRVITNKGKNAGQIIFHLHFHLLAGENLGDII